MKDIEKILYQIENREDEIKSEILIGKKHMFAALVEIQLLREWIIKNITAPAPKAEE